MGEVIIDGVTFEFDESGTKLVKKRAATSADGESSTQGDDDVSGEASTEAPSSTATPLRTSINGHNFVRTKTGNLISKEILDRRRENKLNAAKLKRLDAIGKEIASRQAFRCVRSRRQSRVAAIAKT